MRMSPPSVIILCEESQIGTTAFLRHGFDAYSCDLQQTSGPFPERHFCDDALKVLTGRSWDLVVAHPPCTFLSHVQTPLIVHHPERLKDVAAARSFFLAIWNYCRSFNIPCCIENPKPSPFAQLPLHSQIVHPYMFGDPYYKRTYLWLYRLPGLFATEYCVPGEHWTEKNRSAKMRSKSFPGMMDAMACQFAWHFGIETNVAGRPPPLPSPIDIMKGGLIETND